MHPDDAEMTTFRSPKGVFCYKAMSFGLKNDRATDRRAMNVIFKQMLGDMVECYAHNLVVKSC